MNWIKCSIKSPEENQVVLLTFKNSMGLHVGEATFKADHYLYVAETESGTFEEAYGIPIAWMTMPEPYTFEEIDKAGIQKTISNNPLEENIDVSYKECSVEGCKNKHVAKGYCSKHYYQIREHGRLTPELEIESKKKLVCSVDGCYRKLKGHGLCEKHYYQFVRKKNK